MRGSVYDERVTLSKLTVWAGDDGETRKTTASRWVCRGGLGDMGSGGQRRVDNMTFAVNNENDGKTPRCCFHGALCSWCEKSFISLATASRNSALWRVTIGHRER
jgi:hypothetical protein